MSFEGKRPLYLFVHGCAVLDREQTNGLARRVQFKILEAGEWRSPAFLNYLDINKLEADVVVQAHLDESDGDPE